MKQRTNPYIAVKSLRYRPTKIVTILEAPITSACKRVFKLMEEDYISLDFEGSDDSCNKVAVGDFIQDELFGVFVATKAQIPTYNPKTGGYHYQLKFEREYRVWKNWTFMLTQEINGDRVRHESIWVLTDKLEAHVAEIKKNLDVLEVFYGYDSNEEPLPYVVRIHDTAEHKDEVKCISYNGINILDALKQISDEFETEYWISYEQYTEENVGTYERGIINFGKCEVEGEPVVLSLETNLLDVSISENSSTYANKIYAFGSTDNLPESYRKTLDFKVDYAVGGLQEVDYSEDTYQEEGGLDQHGEEVANSRYCRSVEIPVSKGDKVIYTGYWHISSGNQTMVVGYGLVRKPLLIVASLSGQSDRTFTNYEINIPEGVRYIRAWSANAGTYGLKVMKNFGTFTFCDTTKKITADMTIGGHENKTLTILDVPQESYETDQNTTTAWKRTYPIIIDEDRTLAFKVDGEIEIDGALMVKGLITTDSENLPGSIEAEYTCKLIAVMQPNDKSVEIKSFSHDITLEPDVELVVSNELLDTRVRSSLVNGTYVLYLQQYLTFKNGIPSDKKDGVVWNTALTTNDDDTISFAELTLPKNSAVLPLLFNGTLYHVRLNPRGLDSSSEDSRCFSFIDITKDESDTDYYIDRPSGFDIDSDFTLPFYGDKIGDNVLNEGLIVTKVPLSYFASDYDDPSALTSVGERRLRLPVETGGYISKSGAFPNKTVEKVVFFDKIKPMIVLKITEVEELEKHTKEEYSDGSSTNWTWTQYRFKCKMADGTEFPFSKDFILSGETLKINFLTDMMIEDFMKGKTASDGITPLVSNLCGMTFEVNFRNSTQSFTIVRNEDFGAKLPNNILKPKVGDCFTLVGWDSRAIGSLGLIDQAEEELKAKAQSYLNAIEEDQYTFTCIMKFDYLTGLIPNVPFHTNEDEPTYTTEEDESNLKLYVANDGTYFKLLDEGTKVSLDYLPLGATGKVTRIIGYEYKLDFPFDTPKYTIGETEAYSRLKKIEKEISKL